MLPEDKSPHDMNPGNVEQPAQEPGGPELAGGQPDSSSRDVENPERVALKDEPGTESAEDAAGRPNAGGAGDYWGALKALVLASLGGDETSRRRLEAETQALALRMVPTGPPTAPPKMQAYITRRAEERLELILSRVKADTSVERLSQWMERLLQELSQDYHDATWDLSRVALMRQGRQQAEIELIEKYRAKIKSSASKFIRLCPEGSEDIVQAGLAYFTTSSLRLYNTELGTPLWAFARKHVLHAVREEFRKCEGKSRGQQEREHLVRETLNELRQGLYAEPTPEQIAEATGLTVEAIRRTLAEMTSSGKVSLDDDTDREEGVSASAEQVPDPAPDSDSGPGLQAIYTEIIEYLNAQEPDDAPRPGEKWLVLCILVNSTTEDINWLKTAQLLAQRTPGLGLWPAIWDYYALPAAIPNSWEGVHAMFSDPPPKLTSNALYRWYHRRLTWVRDESDLWDRLMIKGPE